MTYSNNTRLALAHLKSLSPSDGWSVEEKSNDVRLLRRGVALTDNYFMDLFVEPAGRTVGILSSSGRGQILVDASGRPTGKTLQLISCPSYVNGTNVNGNRSVPEPPPPSPNPYATLTDEENKSLLKYAAVAVGSIIALRLIFDAVFYIYILAFPFLYLYGVQTCPSDESFDAKQQLKRVLRGQNLPDDHPDKPRGFFQKTLAKVNASVTTELATSLGYEVSMFSALGACKVASVTVPSVNRTFVWLGVANQWRFLFAQELQTANAAS